MAETDPSCQPSSTARALPKANATDVFLRVRPVPRSTPYMHVHTRDSRVHFDIPKDVAKGFVNNQRELQEFAFAGVLGSEVKQEEVFERVAKKVVLGALDGINGTVFAYGQTGSGKTFTVTGGPARFQDRGIIPRALSCIFEEAAKDANTSYNVHVSYLEIYNETGYDLLHPHRDIKTLEDLPQVQIMEDLDANIHLRGLSAHPVASEEQALNLLFRGDSARTISETRMNLASSRSHCMFIIRLESRQAGRDTVRRSRLNLVDLAGSERSKKTGIGGATLAEANYINLSLHYLEQVIVALQERGGGGHVPYRNSAMTLALRDSLGGNCATVMVATVTAAQEQLEESIATCRFAQRVACLSNQVFVNEEVDHELVVKRLRQEVADLKAELRLLRVDDTQAAPLTEAESKRVQNEVTRYVDDASADARLNLEGGLASYQAAFQALKTVAQQRSQGIAAAAHQQVIQEEASKELLHHANIQLQHRDDEVQVLLFMLERAGAPDEAQADGAMPLPLRVAAQGDDGDARRQAFEALCTSYREHHQSSWVHSSLSKSKYEVAKAYGNKINSSKQRITELKAALQHRKTQRLVASHLANVHWDPQNERIDSQLEEDLRGRIEQEKLAYKDAYKGLEDTKSEMQQLQQQHSQHLSKLQSDFAGWRSHLWDT